MLFIEGSSYFSFSPLSSLSPAGLYDIRFSTRRSRNLKGVTFDPAAGAAPAFVAVVLPLVAAGVVVVAFLVALVLAAVLLVWGAVGGVLVGRSCCCGIGRGVAW